MIYRQTRAGPGLAQDRPRTGIVARLRVSPGAGQNTIEGIYTARDGSMSLKVRVRAQPEKGQVNKAGIAVLAEALGLAKSHIHITGGLGARNKAVRIGGNCNELAGALDAFAGTD